MKTLLPRVVWWPAVVLGAALSVGALAQSINARDPLAQVALQTLLNQGFEVKAAAAGTSGVQTLYLQKASVLYACPLNVSGLACGRVVSR